jgi:hypothetical protein
VRWQDAQCARSMPYQRCSQPAQVTGSQVGSSFATTGRLRVLTDETGVIARDARDEQSAGLLCSRWEDGGLAGQEVPDDAWARAQALGLPPLLGWQAGRDPA